MLNSIFIFIFLGLFVGCNQAVDKADEDAIKNANFYLSSEKCDDARGALEKFKGDKKNGRFLQAAASIDACDAGFSEIKLFANDIELIDVTKFLNSFTEFSTSNETVVDSFRYQRLKRAISVITGSSSSSPSKTKQRIKTYGKRLGNDLSLQASYMILAHLGKWLQFYGNTKNGLKGAGSGNNTCVYSYTDASTLTLLTAGDAGSCVAPFNDGNPLLTAATAANRNRRVCDFVVHLNHFIDILRNADISDNDSLRDFGKLTQTLDDYYDDVNAIPGLSDMLELFDHESCTTFAGLAGNQVTIERYLGVVVELGLK